MRLCLFVLFAVGVARRQVTPVLNGTSQWRFFPLEFQQQETLVLVELSRILQIPSRMLLTADFDTTPIAYRNTSSGLWEISSAFSNVKAWAHHEAYSSLQIPAKKSKV